MPTLKEIIKNLKENFEVVEDIVLTYQNDIYRQNSDDYDDLKKFLSDTKKDIKDLEDKESLLSKEKEGKIKTFQTKNGCTISIPDKSQWKNSKPYYKNRHNKHEKDA